MVLRADNGRGFLARRVIEYDMSHGQRFAQGLAAIQRPAPGSLRARPACSGRWRGGEAAKRH
jgi:hypothetical protein